MHKHMKLTRLFAGLFGMAALSACTSDAPDVNNPAEDDVPSRYLKVSIRSSVAGGTRAEGDQNGTYEDGYSAENEVKSLRFYFFDEDGKAIPVRYTGESYFTCNLDDLEEAAGPDDNVNIEKVVNTVIVINPKDEENRSKIRQMVALVNYQGVESQLSGNMDMAALTSIEATSAINTDGSFLMSNSVFLDGNTTPTAITSTVIKPEDFKSTKEEAAVNPVDVYVERVTAKVRVSMSWKSEMEVVPDVKLGDAKGLTAIALKDKDGNPIKTGYGANDPQVYVIFQGWNLWWTADKTNLFKKIGNWDLGWIWTHPAYNRSYWAENPEGVSLTKYNHVDADLQFGLGKGENEDYTKYTAYCMENAADFGNNGFKKPYDPSKETTNRTLVYLKALLVTLDGKEATPADISEWAGMKYANKNDLLAAMFAPNVDQFYFFDSTNTVNEPQTDEEGNVIQSGETSFKWESLKAPSPENDGDVKLVPAMQSVVDGILADDKSENSPRYLSYVQLAPSAKGKKIYQKTDNGYKLVDEKTVNTQLASVGGAKVWEQGNTYYYQEIQHLGKTGADGSSYGVVRNHIYDMIIESVIGLGTPVLKYTDEEGNDSWEIITPQKPTPDSYFLGTRLNILSWRVVNNNVNLEW